MATAVERTFDTVELLEAILTGVGMQTLYRLSRVCTHWRDVIASSKQLQQILRFEIVDPADELTLERASTIYVPPDDAELEPFMPGWPSYAPGCVFNLNPFMKKVFNYHGRLFRGLQVKKPQHAGMTFFQMQLTHPGTKRVHLWHEVWDLVADPIHLHPLIGKSSFQANEGCVTFGDLLDQLETIAANTSESHLRIGVEFETLQEASTRWIKWCT